MTQPTDDPRFREVEGICALIMRLPSGVLASCSSGYSFHESRRLRVMPEHVWFCRCRWSQPVDSRAQHTFTVIIVLYR